MAIHPDTIATEKDIEAHRRELTGYCYRMLGSGFDAEDAVQETMVRAWRGIDKLSERGALRSWLYRIATNVCYDMLQGAQRRARPMDLASPSTADSALDAGLPQEAWIQPVPDACVLPAEGDPAELAAAKETLRLAFVAALQHLPPRQRVVLILREVLRWQATEVAELLETSVASVNSALQRARATLDELDLASTGPAAVDDHEKQEFLDRYVDAFERYDISELVTLLHKDVTFNMPPFALWLEGPDQVAKWMLGPGAGCENARLRVTSANGCPAVGIYKTTDGKVWEPFNIAVLDVANGGIAGITHFIYPELFAEFGLPARIQE